MSENCDRPRVRIMVLGGVTEIIECDPAVDLEIRDYDIEGILEDTRVKTDENGTQYVLVN